MSFNALAESFLARHLGGRDQLAPAPGDQLEAIGSVVRSGRTLTVCQLEVFAVTGTERTLVALGQQTLICLLAKPAPG